MQSTTDSRPDGDGRKAPPATSLLRRYKWADLKPSEKEAVYDAMGLAATRAGAGLGAVLTIAALISNARRGKAALPPALRYGSLGFFSLAGAYGGFLTGGPAYSRRILSVPDSQLADDLRIVIGDWQSRLPPGGIPESVPHEELPDAPVGMGRGKEEIIARDPKEVRRQMRQQDAQ